MPRFPSIAARRVAAPLLALCVSLLASCGPPGHASLTTGTPKDLGYTPSPRHSPRRLGPERRHRKGRARRRGAVARRCQAILPIARAVARDRGVDLGLLMGIARIESRFRASARNKHTGAAGLMQVMPSTGRYFKCGDLSEPADSLDCGARILKRYINYFDGDMTYGIAAYHAGARAPARARKAGRLPKNFHYVEKALKMRSRFLREGCF